MGWRLWPDVCKEYFDGMFWVLDIMTYFNDYHRELPLRKFFVELQKSDLPNWAKENFLTMFSHDLNLLTDIFIANRKIISESDKAEEWEKQQKKGMEEIRKIVVATGERENKEIDEEEMKYVGISKLPKMLSGQEYTFIIDGIEVKGTKEEFIKRFKKTLLSDKVEKTTELKEIIAENTEKQNFDVLSVPCDKAFVVTPEKSEEFKNLKPTSKVRQGIEDIVKKFRINNLSEKENVLKKTRKIGKK